MHPDLVPGKPLLDLELPDHNGIVRRLSDLAEGGPPPPGPGAQRCSGLPWPLAGF
jgi:hypothetical protein